MKCPGLRSLLAAEVRLCHPQRPLSPPQASESATRVSEKVVSEGRRSLPVG